MLGARSCKCFGNRPSNMWRGSTAWSSTETTVNLTSRGSGGGRDTHPDEETSGTQELQAELKAGEARGEDEYGIDPAEVLGNHFARLARVHGEPGTERRDEVQPVLTNVDADDVVAEPRSQLD